MSQESAISNASTEFQDLHMSRTNQDNLNSFYACINDHELAKRELLILSKCSCCSRHQINKPRNFTAWVELPFHGTQDTPCKCNCRHISRFICRQHPEYKD